jgi:hypothetical protein
MNRLKLLGVSLVALFAMGMMATSAFALPDVSLTLSGSAFPLKLSYANNGTSKTELQSASGAVLSGEGLSLLLSTSVLTALGTFRADFFKVKRSTTNCNSIGDATGVVLTEGTFAVVYTSLSPLTLGVLYSPKAFEVACGSLDIEVQGTTISSLNGTGTEATELTNVFGQLAGTKGKANIKTYYNTAGTALTAKLESNVGAGFAESNQIVEGEPVLTALGSNMFRITGR